MRTTVVLLLVAMAIPPCDARAIPRSDALPAPRSDALAIPQADLERTDGEAALARLDLGADPARPGAQADTTRPDAQADTTRVHPEAREAIGRLWSPYCPGLMLEVCPSPGGEMLRDSIETLARSGVASDSIVELIVAEYGEEYRAIPRVEGIGGLAWYMPPVALIVGLVIVAAFLARRRGMRPEPAGGHGAPSEADEQRLRQAMSQLDEDERPDF